MLFPSIRQDFNNISFLPNCSVASYPNYVAIGELNGTHGFNANQYIKIRFVDFENFAACAKNIFFFLSKSPNSETEVSTIVEIKFKYTIKWSGETFSNVQNKSESIKRVKIFYETFQTKEIFAIYFDNRDFCYLLEGFLNVAFSSILLDPYQLACLKEFLSDLKIQNCDKAYVKSLSNEDCLRIAHDLCNRLGIPFINSYAVKDKLIQHKVEIMLFMDIKKLFEPREEFSTLYQSVKVSKKDSETNLLPRDI
jgi:hypothetical protein